MSEKAEKETEKPVCWNCGAQAVDHFCPSCRRIQPVEAGTDHFSFFKSPRRFNVDAAHLELLFYDLSRKFHPDFFFNAEESERRFSMDRSSKLNDAYRTLKNPVKRARYLLELEGFHPSEGKGKTPPDLLAEVFELNEEMEELRAAKRAQAKNQIELLKRRVLEMESTLKERAERLDDALHEAFSEWDGLPEDDPKRRRALERANAQLTEMSYINNLIEDIEEEIE